VNGPITRRWKLDLPVVSEIIRGGQGTRGPGSTFGSTTIKNGTSICPTVGQTMTNLIDQAKQLRASTACGGKSTIPVRTPRPVTAWIDLGLFHAPTPPKRGPTGWNTGKTGKVPVIGKPGNGPYERGRTVFLPVDLRTFNTGISSVDSRRCLAVGVFCRDHAYASTPIRPRLADAAAPCRTVPLYGHPSFRQSERWSNNPNRASSCSSSFLRGQRRSWPRGRMSAGDGAGLGVITAKTVLGVFR